MTIFSFLFINIGTSLFSRSAGLDVTTSRQYTLSAPTLAWLAENKSPLFVKLYISPDLYQEYPALAQYSQYVIKYLEQYKLHSNNQLNLQIIETPSYSSTEAEAQKQGIRNFLDSSGQRNLYFGAVFSDNKGSSFTLPYFEPARQNYLEHDISRILSKLNGYHPQNIAVISPVLDVADTKRAFENSEDWDFIKQLRLDYNIDSLPNDISQIPLNYKTVIVINPQNLSRLTTYAIDQYLMRGGNIILFMDPFSETFLSLNNYINSSNSNLDQWLENIGVGYDDQIIAGDKTQGQSALITLKQNSKIQNYPLWLNITSPYINPENSLTKDLTNLQLHSTGTFFVSQLPNARVTTLFTTSENGGVIDADTAKYSSKSTIKEQFEETGERYKLGVLIEGKFNSFFHSNPYNTADLDSKSLIFLPLSLQEGKLMLVADSDILFRTNWNQNSPFEGQTPYDYVPFSNNMDFVEKSVDYMSGNHKILSLAPKKLFSGQLSIGQNINRSVESRYQESIEKLNQIIREAELQNQNILQQIEDNKLLPSLNVSKKMDMLQREILTAQHQLKEIEYKIKTNAGNYQNLIIFLNTIVFPAVIILLVMLLIWYKQQKMQKQIKEYTHD